MPPGVASAQSSFSRAGATTPGPPSSFARAATPGRAATNQQASTQAANAAASSFGTRNGQQQQQQQQGQAPGNPTQQPYTGPFHPSTMMFGNGGQTQQPHSFSSSFPQTPGRVATPSFPASFGTATEHATATPTPSARSTQHQRAATARPKTPAPESRDPRLQNRGQSRPPTAMQPQGQGQGQPQTPIFRSSFPNNNATPASFSGAAGPAEQSSFKAPAAMAQPSAASTTRLDGSPAAMPPPQGRPSTSGGMSTNQRATAAPPSGPSAPTTPRAPTTPAREQQQRAVRQATAQPQHSNLGPPLASTETVEDPSASQGHDIESSSAVTTPSGGIPPRETSSGQKRAGMARGSWTGEEDEKLRDIMAYEADNLAAARIYVTANPNTQRSLQAVKQRAYNLRKEQPSRQQQQQQGGSKRGRSNEDASDDEDEGADFESGSFAPQREKRRKSTAPDARRELVIPTGRQSRNSIAAAVEAAQPGASIGLASTSAASTSTAQQQQQRQGPDYREAVESEDEDEEGAIRQQRRRRRGRPSRRSPAAAAPTNGDANGGSSSGAAVPHHNDGHIDDDEEIFHMRWEHGNMVVEGASTENPVIASVKPRRIEVSWTPSGREVMRRRVVATNADANGGAVGGQNGDEA